MKTKFYIMLILILIIGMVLPGSVRAADTNLSDIEIAQQTGQQWLTKIAEHNSELGKWTGASLSHPETYYDLSDEIVAYAFHITAKEETVGYILVGSAPYNYPSLFFRGKLIPKETNI